MGPMSGEYEPREHDHLIEPMIHAVHGEGNGASEGAAQEASGPPEEVSWKVRWAGLLVPASGIAIAVVVWGAYRLFNWLDVSRALDR
jgi:hypothetical protein